MKVKKVTVTYFVNVSIIIIIWLTKEEEMIMKYQFTSSQKIVDHGNIGE